VRQQSQNRHTQKKACDGSCCNESIVTSHD
jgi:hypothetical protein